jgi:hypothetical protein
MSDVTPPRWPAPLRRIIVCVGLAVTAAVLVFQLRELGDSAALSACPDYAMYWATGRLLLTGEDPYEPEKLLPLQRQCNPEQAQAFVAYSPPWLLPLLLPFCPSNHAVGRVLWLLLHALLVLLCADGAWRLYGGPARWRWLAWVIGFTFIPTLIMLKTGQIGSFLLTGAVGFLYFERRGRDVSAGAAAALMALKPHLVYLFWLALLLWVIERRRWRILLGGGLVGLAATLIPLALDPEVLWQYGRAVMRHPPTDWVTPTAGTALRLAFGEEKRWLQFVPLVPGTLWFLAYWRGRRKEWEWAEQMPLLLLVSFLTTCYGAWSHDYVLLLLPIVQVACRIAGRFRPLPALAAVAVYVAVNGLIVALNVTGYSDELFLLWMSPALLLSYLGLCRYYGQPSPGFSA